MSNNGYDGLAGLQKIVRDAIPMVMTETIRPIEFYNLAASMTKQACIEEALRALYPNKQTMKTFIPVAVKEVIEANVRQAADLLSKLTGECLGHRRPQNFRQRCNEILANAADATFRETCQILGMGGRVGRGLMPS
jgi:hypothetical protein